MDGTDPEPDGEKPNDDGPEAGRVNGGPNAGSDSVDDGTDEDGRDRSPAVEGEGSDDWGDGTAGGESGAWSGDEPAAAAGGHSDGGDGGESDCEVDPGESGADATGTADGPAGSDGPQVPRQYVQVDAFDMPAVAAADAGPGVIAVATGDGRVDLITSGDRRRVARRDDVLDVAVADRVYALSGTELEAFSHSGSRVWGVDVADGRSVDADPDNDRVYVRTGDGEFVVVEGRTGIEAGRFDQPHAEVAESPAVAAADGRLAVASWSFLTVLDADGEQLDERTLSGAVTDVGLLSGRAVVSLKGGQLVGYEGERREWEIDGDVSWLADAGESALAARVSGSDLAVDADGNRHPLDGVSGTPIATTPSLDLVCTVGSGTATVYAAVGQADDAVGVEIEGDSLRPRDPTVVIALANESDGAVEVDATVEAEGARVASSNVSATIDTGATQRRRVSLHSVDGDAVDVTATVGEESVTKTLEVQEETTALRVETDLEAVEDGTLTATIRVENVGKATVSGVTVGETTVGTLDPGAAEAVPFEQNLPSGDVEVRADGVDPLEAETAVPVTPTAIDLEAESDGFLLVTLHNETPVAVDDDVSVDGVPDEDGSFSMPVSIPADGAYRIALPVTVPGDRSVTVETSGGHVSERLGLARCSLLPAGGTGVAGGGDAGRTGGTAGSSRRRGGSPGRAQSGVEGGDGSIPISIDRRFPSETPRRGAVFEERLVVSNDDPEPVEFHLRTDDGAYAQRLKVRGGGEAVGTRYHVPLRSSLSLPRVEVEHEGKTASVPATERAVEDGELVAMITWQPDGPDDGVLSVTLESDEGEWAVEEAVVGGERSAPIDATVSPDSPAHVTVTTPYTLQGDVAKAFVRARRTDRHTGDGPQQVNTLVVRESVVGTDSDRVDDLSIDVGPQSRVERGFGSVFLSVANDGSRPVESVSVDAEGTNVEKTMYAEGSDGDDLASGESVRYLVDLEGVDAGERIAIDAEVSAGDAATSATVTATADDEGAVASDAWDLDVESDESGLPQRLSTQYE
ncbi:hypothetical protein [Halobaculum gomorrense]|uniref:Uncharacterized protein n=1 Tax=Halobaculum gomorrense TaxID=43928 RepID=A0A1M5NUH7_9EURY|nr:hypothetical protein [Halobaculum gomorrense]SHG93191.1 hypothetical protein SAMN05443636_1351 [Halobaculum gomorrense]